MEHVNCGRWQSPGAERDGCLALNAFERRLAVRDLKTGGGATEWNQHPLQHIVVDGLSILIPLEGGILAECRPLGSRYQVQRAAHPGEMKVELRRQLKHSVASVDSIRARWISSLSRWLLELKLDGYNRIGLESELSIDQLWGCAQCDAAAFNS